MTKLFYGAGHNARLNINRWISEGNTPVCFVDMDIDKQREPFIINDQAYQAFDVLSLQDAILRYPDYELYLTQTTLNLLDITNTLISQGIPKERIKYCEQVEYCKRCHSLGTMIMPVENGKKIVACCTPKIAPKYNSSGNIEKDINILSEKCSEIISKLKNGLQTTCDNCPELTYGMYLTNPKISILNLSSNFKNDACNFKCIYCSFDDRKTNTLTKETSSYFDSAYDVLKTIGKDSSIKTIDLNNGEITCSPHCEEIINILKNNDFMGNILTNASIYKQGIADLLASRKFTIGASLDAGTAETFAKVKGVDCFDRVVKNLKKYAATGGTIYLKYVFLENINDNINDIDHFLSIAREIADKSNIKFSIDMFSGLCSDKIIKMIYYFIDKCKDMGMTPQPVLNTFQREDVIKIFKPGTEKS